MELEHPPPAHGEVELAGDLREAHRSSAGADDDSGVAGWDRKANGNQGQGRMWAMSSEVDFTIQDQLHRTVGTTKEFASDEKVVPNATYNGRKAREATSISETS